MRNLYSYWADRQSERALSFISANSRHPRGTPLTFMFPVLWGNFVWSRNGRVPKRRHIECMYVTFFKFYARICCLFLFIYYIGGKKARRYFCNYAARAPPSSNKWNLFFISCRYFQTLRISSTLFSVENNAPLSNGKKNISFTLLPTNISRAQGMRRRIFVAKPIFFVEIILREQRKCFAVAEMSLQCVLIRYINTDENNSGRNSSPRYLLFCANGFQTERGAREYFSSRVRYMAVPINFLRLVCTPRDSKVFARATFISHKRKAGIHSTTGKHDLRTIGFSRQQRSRETYLRFVSRGVGNLIDFN